MASSFGLWMRLQANPAPAGTRRLIVTSASSTRAGSTPAAPKEARKPAPASATTSSADAIPLAIAPAMYGWRTPWSRGKSGDPSRSGGASGTAASTCVPGPSSRSSLVAAIPWASRTTKAGRSRVASTS